MGHFFFFQEIVPSTKMKHAGTIFSLVKSLFSIFWQMNAVLSVHSKANLWLAKVPYLILLQVNTSQIQSYPRICVKITQNFLPLRFYVKSNLAIFGSQKTAILTFLESQNLEISSKIKIHGLQNGQNCSFKGL